MGKGKKRSHKALARKIHKLSGGGKTFKGKKMYPMAATKPYGFPIVPVLTGLAGLIGAGASAATKVKGAVDAFKPARVEQKPQSSSRFKRATGHSRS